MLETAKETVALIESLRKTIDAECNGGFGLGTKDESCHGRFGEVLVTVRLSAAPAAALATKHKTFLFFPTAVVAASEAEFQVSPSPMRGIRSSGERATASKEKKAAAVPEWAPSPEQMAPIGRGHAALGLTALGPRLGRPSLAAMQPQLSLNSQMYQRGGSERGVSRAAAC